MTTPNPEPSPKQKPGEFTPDLTLLDAVVASVRVEPIGE